MTIKDECHSLNSSGRVILYSSSGILEEEYSIINIPEKLNKAVESRKVEFQKGRYLAKILLAKFGSNESVLIGKGREPVWPNGFRGSISHCKGYYVTVVASADEVRGVGIDIEEIGRVKEELCRMIRTKDDIIDSHLSSSELNTLIFSAKESLYKMLYPSVKKFFGFKDAAIIEVKEGSFTIQLKKTLSSQHKVDSIYKGRFIITDEYLLSYLEY